MDYFLQSWSQAAMTSLGFFWMALWAFAFGYLISSLIQVLVTEKRMQEKMGKEGFKSVALGTFFGFISSSCSFAALSTTRAIFQRGAGFIPSIAFLLASTNLVIELGIVIGIFLGWQFIVGEYIGGILLIAFAWLFVKLTNPKKLIENAREHLSNDEEGDAPETSNWKKKITSQEGWQQIGMKYVMEWQMVWKDVLIGFTVAGIISAFVPKEFFETLFIGSGTANAGELSFFEVLFQTLIGPIAAFLTFIGSMGNIPLAALLFDHGVSFAGVMAFIFSDLVVLPILRINAQYYGWKMALYIMILLLSCLVATSLVLHYGFAAFDILPNFTGENSIIKRDMFKLDYGFVLNIIFLFVSGILGLLWWKTRTMNHEGHEHGSNQVSKTEWLLRIISIFAIFWLFGGLILKLIGIN
ncbi:MAG: permease [Arcobacter sp.]|uniref:permease n=1 Tax=uncultured Arcobacter sp. TaxID=165434 RepID=UPI000CC63078|nr:permease [uncultured Arcobacter sp.]PLY11161.1 MAG: permease [Arcobacter sp.]